MKLLVENIAKIQHAEVKIDGISVLAGYNATGKSTVSKSLNAIILAYTDVFRKAKRSQFSSIGNALNSFFQEISSEWIFVSFNYQYFAQEFLSNKIQLPGDYEHFRSQLPSYRLDIMGELPETTGELEHAYQKLLAQLQKVRTRSIEDYVQFVVGNSIQKLFDYQVNTLGQSTLGKIVLSDDSGVVICGTSFIKNRILECSYKDINESVPLYLEPKHTLDSLPSESRILRSKDTILSLLLAHDEDQTDGITIEMQEKLEYITALIEKEIHGGLTESGESLQYRDENSFIISLKNLASGNKTFAVIKRLLENGQLYKNQTLIIDEPEVNLHPEWQLALAQILVILYKELGLKIFLNSHSPYFIRAVEASSKRYDIADHCFFYRTKPGENGLYQVEDVTNETEKIYRDLYRPLEEL